MTKKLHIVVGMSGGVDSAVASLLLQQAGHKVTAVFMQNWQDQDQNQDKDQHCSAAKDYADATQVCKILNIPLLAVNFSKEYWQQVFEYFLNEYANFRTPNPDVLCNKEIKFKAFLSYANELGADYIATGHYVRIEFSNNKFCLLKGVDATKDQSYFLYLLNQDQLAKSLFPVGHLTKTRVREIAAAAHFPNQHKKDSTGICFIGERKFKAFLSEYLLAKPGVIITTDNKTIGEHDGLMFYTIGQRQGLKIGGQKNAAEAPWYVAAKDIKNNLLIVTQNRMHPLLSKTQLISKELHWISNVAPKMPYSCAAKIRYRQLDQACTISQTNNESCSVEFKTPQWAITPGQSVVFYNNDECLGGGIIV